MAGGFKVFPLSVSPVRVAPKHGGPQSTLQSGEFIPQKPLWSPQTLIKLHQPPTEQGRYLRVTCGLSTCKLYKAPRHNSVFYILAKHNVANGGVNC